MTLEAPMKLFYEKLAISTAHNPVQHDRIKHVAIDKHFIKKLNNDFSIVNSSGISWAFCTPDGRPGTQQKLVFLKPFL